MVVGQERIVIADQGIDARPIKNNILEYILPAGDADLFQVGADLRTELTETLVQNSGRQGKGLFGPNQQSVTTREQEEGLFAEHAPERV